MWQEKNVPQYTICWSQIVACPKLPDSCKTVVFQTVPCPGRLQVISKIWLCLGICFYHCKWVVLFIYTTITQLCCDCTLKVSACVFTSILSLLHSSVLYSIPKWLGFQDLSNKVYANLPRGPFESATDFQPVLSYMASLDSLYSARTSVTSL